MSFNWRNYVSLAEELSRDAAKRESALRSAISRAYYGVFCLCRNHFGFKYNKDKIGTEHQQLIHFLKYHKQEYKGYIAEDDRIKIGYLLESLRDERNDADYDGNYDVKLQKVKLMIEKAERILRIIDDAEAP